MSVRISAATLLVISALFGCSSGGDPSGPGGGSNPLPPQPPPAEAVASISLDRTEVRLLPAATSQLSATARDSKGAVLSGRTISWTSGNSAVATVSSNGLVTAVATGTTTVSATSEGKSAQATITVDPEAVGTVELQLPSQAMEVGAVTTVTATLKAANGNVLNGRALTWSSSDQTVATVSNGTVTAVAPGQTTITASAEGKSGSGTITVVPVPVATVVMSPSTVTVEIGLTATVSATARSQSGAELSGRMVEWTTSDVAIATVANGTITGVSQGAATVTATVEGKSAAVAVTVTPQSVSVVEVTPGNQALFVGGTATFSAVTRAVDGAVLEGRTITWSSDAPAVATVANGVVTAVSVGTTTIRATSEGKTGTAQIAVSAPPPISQSTRTIGMGAWNGCALVAGKAWCWGRGSLGNLGNGTTISQSTIPVAVLGGHIFSSISGGWNYSCAIDASSDAWCWGWGSLGALGNGSTDDQTSPVAVTGGLKFRQIHAAGLERLACGVSTNNKAYCWGSNSDGGLGAGAGPGFTASPVAVAGGHSFMHVAVGNSHACALTLSGEAWCWGSNLQGQLGNGTTTSSSVPVKVQGGHTFFEIATGYLTTCAIKADGSSWCWGGNGAGQLGNGTVTQSSIPVATSGGHQFSSIVGGGAGFCALKTNGSAWCWGLGSDGRNGNGSNSNQLSPTPVSGGHIFTQIVSGTYATCGLTTSDIYCWGGNSYGALGDGTTTARNVPVRVQMP